MEPVPAARAEEWDREEEAGAEWVETVRDSVPAVIVSAPTAALRCSTRQGSPVTGRIARNAGLRWYGKTRP
jgi:hypothetical protein